MTPDRELLLNAKDRWVAARREAEQARHDLDRIIAKVDGHGFMSQTEIAGILGWPRQRVNVVLKH